jgi:inner membrane protein
MTGRTHDLAAVTALGLMTLQFPPGPLSLTTVLVALLANQIGGIAPDIDQPTAPFWRNLPIGGWVGRVLARGLGGHRFLTHSLIGIALMGYLTWLLLAFISPIMPHVATTIVWQAFMIGLVSHLIMDSFTEEGVPWLLPVPVKFGFPPMRKWRITTGKFVETIVVFPGLVAINLWYLLSHYQQLLELLHRNIN